MFRPVLSNTFHFLGSAQKARLDCHHSSVWLQTMINAQIARVNSNELIKKWQLFMFYLKKYILHMLAAWYLKSFGRSTVAGPTPRSCMDYPYLCTHVLSMISFPELPLGRPGSKSHILLLWERIVFKVWTFYSNTPACKREEREKPSASRMILSPESTMGG